MTPAPSSFAPVRGARRNKARAAPESARPASLLRTPRVSRPRPRAPDSSPSRLCLKPLAPHALESRAPTPVPSWVQSLAPLGQPPRARSPNHARPCPKRRAPPAPEPSSGSCPRPRARSKRPQAPAPATDRPKPLTDPASW